ncbi:MAG: hypothetical protein QFX37_06655 [Archaeoglobales archaeon]|nr:hypothetical protein [Archaeoglobales archaeon]
MDPKTLLKGMLEKAYRIEAGFESEANFKAFVEVMDEEQKKVLFQLMSDSERHKVLIEEIAKNLGIEIEKRAEEFNFQIRGFSMRSTNLKRVQGFYMSKLFRDSEAFLARKLRDLKSS